MRLGLLAGSPGTAPPPACADDRAFAERDFWPGEWDVFVGDQSSEPPR